MRVLFLDVDGVLNRAGTKAKNPFGMDGVEPEKVELIRKVVNATGCFIVMSSTWRGLTDLTV